MNNALQNTILDLESLLEPIHEAAPCGTSLDTFLYNENYLQLSRRFTWDERQREETFFNGVNWSEVSTQCQLLFSQCKSARVVAFWLLPLVKLHGLSGLIAGLNLLDSLVRRYWDDFEPLLYDEELYDKELYDKELYDKDKEESPARSHALHEICGKPLLLLIDDIVLWEKRSEGVITVKQLLIATGKRQSEQLIVGEHAVGLNADKAETIRNASQGEKTQLVERAKWLIQKEGVKRDLRVCARQVAKAVDCLWRIDQYVNEKMSNYRVDFSALMRPLQLLRTSLSDLTGESVINNDAMNHHLLPKSESLSVSDDQIDAIESETMRQNQDTVSTDSVVNFDCVTLNSRDQVIDAINAILRYYRTHEPSSPIPAVLDRAKRWVDRDFLELLADIAPKGMEEAMKVLSPVSEEK